MSATPTSSHATHTETEQSGAHQIAALMDQVRTKDALVMQLTERLEAAAEQLDRLQRSGADKVRPGGGGGGSRELVEQTGQLTSRVEEALECWNQSSGHYEFILQRLEEISQHIFSTPEGGGGESRAARPVSSQSPAPTSGGTPQAGGAGQGGSFWERMKASMVEGTPPPISASAKPATDLNDQSQEVENTATDESIAEQLAAIEQVAPAPTVIDVEVASIEELREAVTTRDNYISALIKEFREIQFLPSLPEDFENSGLAPAELLTSLKELESRFKTGIQRENFELSLERARMGRERSRLDQVKAQLEGQIKRLASSVPERTDASPSTAPQSSEPSIAEGKLSWLKRLQPKKPQG